MGRIKLDYSLPEELIAQSPSQERENSRLLVLSRNGGGEPMIEHKRFSDILNYVRPGDCIVINNTKVFPAKIFCNKDTGGRVELLFLKSGLNNRWTVLSRRDLLGRSVVFPDTTGAKCVGRTGNGEYIIEFRDGVDVFALLEKYGIMPLPPYIHRDGSGEQSGNAGVRDEVHGTDFERYQTVYADVTGSVACPTAGLHFTHDLLGQLEKKGVEVVRILLHIGWGTFRPIRTENVHEHKMLPEYFEVSEGAAERVNLCRRKGGRVFGVGTSVVRSLEASSDEDGCVRAFSGETDLFIYPGYRFKTIDALITNFHLPMTTPLALVSAFAGAEIIFRSYREAIKNKYRFYSYGDAMLIL